MTARRAALVAGALGLSASPRAVAAAPATAVSLVAPPCIEQPYDRSRLVELLRVELRALGVTEIRISDAGGRKAARDETLLASIVLLPSVCAPAATEVSIQVVDLASAKTSERRMTLADVDVAGRPRALAIAIAELLQASLVELSLTAAPPAAVALPEALPGALAARLTPVVEGARAEASREARRLLDADAQARASAEDAARDRERAARVEGTLFADDYASRATALVGLGLSIHARVGSHVALSIGAEGGAGDARTARGDVVVRAVTTSGAVLYTSGGSTELEVGPRLRAGYGWATGSATVPGVTGSSYGNAVVLALLSATLRVHTAGHAAPFVGVDVGHTVANVDFLSDDARVAGLGGVVGTLRAGVGLGL